MKRLYATTYILMALDVLVASVLIHLMPDQVPVHFNGANEPDRLGSKYEFLVAILFPLCGVFVLSLIHIFTPALSREPYTTKAV